MLDYNTVMSVLGEMNWSYIIAVAGGTSVLCYLETKGFFGYLK